MVSMFGFSRGLGAFPPKCILGAFPPIFKLGAFSPRLGRLREPRASGDGYDDKVEVVKKNEGKKNRKVKEGRTNQIRGFMC